MISSTRRFTTICVLVTAGVGLVGCPYPGEPFSFYHDPVTGAKVPIILETSSIALDLEGWLSEEEVTALIDGEPFLEGVNEDNNYPVGLIVAGATNEEILATIDSLNATPGVNWANPIVHWRYPWTRGNLRYSDNEQILDVEFIADFRLSASTDDIEALNAEEAVQILQIEEGPVTTRYHLRITAESTRSTLDMINFYYEHPLTLRAYPLFHSQAVF